ncbi:mycofactocin precursor [Nocardia fluminea]|uniref:Mycofactocin n=3 Tax=Nocardia TaxID=1817 RepID=A0A2N3VCQ8_9NOCA|nr:mycofactocin precursor [Nocardia fluminea]
MAVTDVKVRVTGNTMEVVMPENTTPATVESDEDLVTETLIEEVSIDGMCGVY